MRFQSQILAFSVVILTIFFAACSSNTPTPSQTSPTTAPSENTQSTSAPVPTATTVVSAQATTAATTAPASQATTAPAATTAASPAAPSSGSGALDLITAAMQAQFSAKSFRQTSVRTDETGGTSTTIVEYVAPDRMHVNRPGATGPANEFIIIKGQGTWLKTNGQWAKSPVDLSGTFFSIFDPKNIQELRSTVDIGTLQLVGPDLIGTTPTFVYQYNQSIKGAGLGGGPLNGTYKVWVGVTDHRIYKVEGDTDSATKAGAKTHTLVTTEYDVSIQIQPPI